MLSIIARGMSLGFAAGSIPGPLHTFLINETLLRGWRGSLPIVFTPLVSDIPIILLMVVVLDNLPADAVRGLQVVGGVFIFSLAWGAWRQAGRVEQLTASAANLPRFAFGRALMLNWLNPAPYIFWGTVNGPLLVNGLAQSVWHGLGFLLAFYAMFLGMMTLVVLLFERVRRSSPRVIPLVLRLTAFLLLVFGVSLIAQGVGGV